MIAGLQGTLESQGTDWAIIKVGGISFRVYMPTSTMSALGDTGSKVQVHTHLHVREDNLTLYGFASTAELELFQMLISVSGIGPRSGLAMLSALNPDDLARAIISENTELLSSVPGIGKKTAGRLVLELKGKLGAVWVGAAAATEGDADVVAALISLGYSPADAASALAAIPNSADLTVEDKIRLALQNLASR
jgi:Holliday junction DNA helicase RuvA